jgi:hypothetical protein
MNVGALIGLESYRESQFESIAAKIFRCDEEDAITYESEGTVILDLGYTPFLKGDIKPVIGTNLEKPFFDYIKDKYHCMVSICGKSSRYSDYVKLKIQKFDPNKINLVKG